MGDIASTAGAWLFYLYPLIGALVGMIAALYALEQP